MRVLSNRMKFFLRDTMVTIVFFTAGLMLAQNQQPQADARSLAAAETAFAYESIEKGTRTAFLDALSDDGIVFQPGPENGKKIWQAEKESSGQLQWQPVLAVVAASGDLGYTTGPWSYKKKASDEEAGAFGQFVSIWRHEGGKWKLLFDLGSQNQKPTESAPALQIVDLKPPPAESNSPSPRASLFQSDREYAAAAQANFPARAAEDVRVLRPGEFPAVGKPAAEKTLKNADQPSAFGEAKGEISKAGDLGFAWGEYSSTASGYYLRIWRRDDGREWKLALEVLHPR